MSAQTWQELLGTATAPGALFTAFTTAKSVSPYGSAITLPPNWWYVGRAVRLSVHAAISNQVTIQNTMNFAINLGAVAAATSGNFNLTTSVHTTIPAYLTCLATCMTVGTSTNAALKCVWMAEGQMFAQVAGAADNAAGTGWAMSAAIPANGTGFDSTASLVMDFFAGISTNTTSNGIQVHQITWESLN
jgi:hypothetical protein